MTRLTRVTLMLAALLLVDKGVAIVRQVIIANQFKFSQELDAFNVANNIPDLLFALISGGALAMAFIPVLSEVISLQNRRAAWKLFSQIANIAFTATFVLALGVALFADPMVRSEIGVAPGFEAVQQDVVIQLMRLNLLATLIFSVSGLVMAGLQANQHFLLPALAPIFYNLGQIFGALILAPVEGYVLGGVRLPAMGLGVHGLVYGVIIGALLHLGIQVPGLVKYRFTWSPSFGLGEALVRRVLRLMAPRLLTMFCIQLTFIVRDNLASRLEEGAVSALTYGWMIMQVPETVLGTAIGIALLPTLAELAALEKLDEFKATIQRAVRVLLGLALPAALLLALGLQPVLNLVFHLGERGDLLLLWASRSFLVGLVGHTLLEVAVRSFYARQDALTPLFTAALNLVLYTLLGSLFFRIGGAPAIALADSLAFTSQAVILLYLLRHKIGAGISFGSTLPRAVLAAAVGGLVYWLVAQGLQGRLAAVLVSAAGMALGLLAAVPLIWREVRLTLRL